MKTYDAGRTTLIELFGADVAIPSPLFVDQPTKEMRILAGYEVYEPQNIHESIMAFDGTEAHSLVSATSSKWATMFQAVRFLQDLAAVNPDHVVSATSCGHATLEYFLRENERNFPAIFQAAFGRPIPNLEGVMTDIRTHNDGLNERDSCMQYDPHDFLEAVHAGILEPSPQVVAAIDQTAHNHGVFGMSADMQDLSRGRRNELGARLQHVHEQRLTYLARWDEFSQRLYAALKATDVSELPRAKRYGMFDPNYEQKEFAKGAEQARRDLDTARQGLGNITLGSPVAYVRALLDLDHAIFNVPSGINAMLIYSESSMGWGGEYGDAPGMQELTRNAMRERAATIRPFKAEARSLARDYRRFLIDSIPEAVSLYPNGPSLKLPYTA